MCALFTVSALLHRRVWTAGGYQAMKRLDHAMIYIFIAGTYTPICALLLPAGKTTLLLALVWAGAKEGVAIAVIWTNAPRWVSASLYLGLGWAAVTIIPDVLAAGGVAAVVNEAVFDPSAAHIETSKIITVISVSGTLGGHVLVLGPWVSVFSHSMAGSTSCCSLPSSMEGLT